MDQPPLPEPPPEFALLEEEELQALFVGLCQGDWRSSLDLEFQQHHQFQSYALSRLAMLWTEIEQRTRG